VRNLIQALWIVALPTLAAVAAVRVVGRSWQLVVAVITFAVVLAVAILRDPARPDTSASTP
jgi:hypothetical protein